MAQALSIVKHSVSDYAAWRTVYEEVQPLRDKHGVTAADVLPYLKNAVVCPSGGKTFADSYAITTVAARPTCLKVPATHKLEETLQ